MHIHNLDKWWHGHNFFVPHHPRSASEYKQLLAGLYQIKHISIEVINCGDKPCIALEQAV
jgi:hypothetical protein